MPFPMTTGYDNQQEEVTEPVDNMQEDSAEGRQSAAQPSDSNPLAQPSGPVQRTGADVLAKCLAQPSVCGGMSGTTAPQGDMSYGADPGYGA